MPLAMADDPTNPSFQEPVPEAGRSPRAGGGREGSREPGGFRIRLSDNELRAARAVQEAFRLRSTVAALGFALRTTAQLLEEGKLDELAEQLRSQAPARGDGRRGDGPRGGRSDVRSEGRAQGRSDRSPDRSPRVDPFARPARPAAPQVAPEPEPETEAEAQVAPEAPETDVQDASAADGAQGESAAQDAPSGEA
ncbi:MAG: hypothetical protein VKM92_04220 [Cyanobacteriota bacterium]|nr:hypothetical protein [Cyanobacteriota bacterium]